MLSPFPSFSLSRPCSLGLYISTMLHLHLLRFGSNLKIFPLLKSSDVERYFDLPFSLWERSFHPVFFPTPPLSLVGIASCFAPVWNPKSSSPTQSNGSFFIGMVTKRNSSKLALVRSQANPESFSRNYTGLPGIRRRHLRPSPPRSTLLTKLLQRLRRRCLVSPSPGLGPDEPSSTSLCHVSNLANPMIISNDGSDAAKIYSKLLGQISLGLEFPSLSLVGLDQLYAHGLVLLGRNSEVILAHYREIKCIKLLLHEEILYGKFLPLGEIFITTTLRLGETFSIKLSLQDDSIIFDV